jgi:ubiquitin-protein ligase
MFAICQDCYAPPSARVVVRELSPKVVIQILDIVLPSVITTPSQKHALVMVLHLVELLDQNITATCEAFWRAVQLITMAGDRSLCHRVITILSKLISNPTTYRDSVLRLIATISSCISMMNATSCLSTWELVRCICNNRETNNAFAKQYTVTFCQSLLSLITVSLKQRGVFSNAGDATGGVVRWIDCIVAYLAGCALELIFELDTPSLHELSSVDEHGSASGDVELLISMLSSHLFGRAPLRTLTAATVAEASERGNDKSYAEHAISADATYAQLSRSLFNDYVSPNQDLFDQHQEEATDSTEARYFDADFMLRSSVVRLMRGWLSRSADSAEWLFGIICSTGVSSFTSATFGLGLSLITTADVACRVVVMDELLRLIREILKSSGSNFNPRRIDAPALPSHRDVCEHVMQLLCILVQFPEAASQLVKSPCFPELLEAVTMTVPTLPELCERMLVLLAKTNSTWMAGFVKQVFESRGGTVPHAAYFKIFTVMAAATNSTSVAEAIAEQANAFILSHPAESLTVLEPCVHTLRNIVRGFPQLLETSIDLPGLVEKTMEYLDSGMGHRIDSSLTSPSAIEQVCLATVCRHNLRDSETAMDTPPTASAGRENHVLLRPGTRVQSTCNTGSVTIGNLGVHISMAAGVIWDKIPGEPQQHDINFLEPVTSDRVGDVTGNEAIFCARLPAPGLSWASDQEKLFGCIVCVESISQGVALVTNSDGEITTVSKGALLPIVYAEDLQLDQTELTTQITACGFTLDLVRLMVPPMVHAFTVKLATAVIKGSSPVDELNELEDLECSRFAHSLLLGLLAMREPRVEHTLLSSTNLAEELLGVIHAEFDAHVLQPNAVMPSLRFWATVSVSKRWCDIFVEHVSVTDLLAYTCKYQEGSPSIVCGPVTTDSIHKLLGKLIGNIMRFHPNTISNVISVHQSIPPAILGYLLRFRRTKTILLQGPEAGIPAADLSIPIAWLNFASQLPVTSGLVLDVPIELSVETIGDRIFGKQRASDAERRIVGGRRGLLEFCGRLCHVGDSVTLTESATAHPGKIVALFPTEVWIDVNGKCQIFRTRSLQYGLVQIERKEEQPEDIDRFQTQGACFAATTQTQGACFAAAEFQPECELVVNCNRSGITVQALPNMDTGGSAGGEGQSPLADFAVAFAQTGSLYSILSTNCSELLRSSGADAPVTNRRAVSRKVSRAAMTARVLDTTTEDIRLYLRMFQSYMSIPGFVHYLLRDPLGKCFVYGFSGCFNPAKFAIKPAQSLVTAGITFRSKGQRTDRMDERFNKVLLYALKQNADATVPTELYVTILQMLLESIQVQSSAVKIASSSGIQWDAALMDCVRPGVYRCFGVDKVEYQPDSPEFSSASSQASTGDYYGSGDGSDENTDHIINLQLPVQTSFQRSHDARAVLIGDPIELDVPLRLEIRLLEVRPGSSISIGFHPPCRAKSLSQRGRGGAFAPIDRGFWFNVTTGSFAEGMDILPGLNLSIGSAVVFGCGVDWATQTMHFSVGPNIIATLPLEKADGPLCPFVVVLGTAEIETNIGNMPLVCNMPTAVRGPGVHAFTRPAGRSRMIPISRAPKITTTKPPDADDELAMLDSRTTGLPRKLELVGQLLSILPSSLTSDIMSKSSIIDTITAHLANDSITAMSRDADLYLQILQLVQTMIKYGVSPATTQMLATQVAALRQVANAFLTVAKAGKSSGKPATEIGLGLGAIELANALLSTAALFPDPNAGCPSSDNDTGNVSGTSGSSDSGAIKVSGGDGSSSDQSMPSASFDIGYSTFLNRELSVRSMEIVGHQFENEAMKSSGGGMGSKGKAGKIMRELADMMNSLPCEATNAVFVVADENRVDMLQALITGAEGTPYESGCFVFDVYCPDQYPKQCPKVQLITTGRGTSVRFSPNLYATGKVCLSLLGTWEGMDSSESWSTSSTLMQVFTSIQSLIMTKNVYYNEPSISILASPSEAEKLNRGYENIVRYCTVKHAMNDHLRQPQGCFQDVVARHFYAKRDAILQQCEAWLTDAASQSSDDVAYTGLVADHNPELAMNFSSSPLAYHDALETAAVELRSHLGALDEPAAAEEE